MVGIWHVLWTSQAALVCQSLLYAQVSMLMLLACSVFHSSGDVMCLENSLFHTWQGGVAAPLVGGRPAFVRHTWYPAVDAMPHCPPGVLSAYSRMITAFPTAVA